MEVWETALAAALEENATAGRKPDSIRSLAKALAAHSGGSPTEESWHRTIRRYVSGEKVPSEARALEIAHALGIPRTRLPETDRPTLAGLLVLLRELEARMDASDLIQDRGSDKFEQLAARVEHLSEQVAHLQRRIEPGSSPGEGNAR